MNTLRLFAAPNISIPASTSWYLADLGEFRGKQELYTQQSPQRLKTLREHAINGGSFKLHSAHVPGFADAAQPRNWTRNASCHSPGERDYAGW